MADFCKQCSTAIFGADCEDLSGLAQGEDIVSVLCEGCGPTYVDSTGTCVNVKCLEKHGVESNIKITTAAQHDAELVAPVCECDGRNPDDGPCRLCSEKV